MLRTFADPILALIYPQECAVCRLEVSDGRDGIACSSCWNETRLFTGKETLCTKCGAFLFEHARGHAIFCQKCETHSYDAALAAGIYEKALATSVLRLKKTPHLPVRIRESVRFAFERLIDGGAEQLVIPVPLSSRRMRERGFNQASVIGRFVARAAGFPLDELSLIRNVHTPMHRAGMDRKARARTVENAFQVVRPKLIANMDILLIDDVLTSGETASSCAQVLKESGARSVRVLTIARAV
jgi:ComF family protein